MTRGVLYLYKEKCLECRTCDNDDVPWWCRGNSIQIISLRLTSMKNKHKITYHLTFNFRQTTRLYKLIYFRLMKWREISLLILTFFSTLKHPLKLIIIESVLSLVAKQDLRSTNSRDGIGKTLIHMRPQKTPIINFSQSCSWWW